MIGSALAGLVCALSLAYLCNLAALQVWRAYATVFPSRAFTPPMLLTRQTVGLVVTIVGGYVVSALSGQSQRPVLWTGIVGLAGAHWIHLQEPTWSQYPVWYHLLFFSYLIPGPLLGGRLNRRVKLAQSA